MNRGRSNKALFTNTVSKKILPYFLQSRPVNFSSTNYVFWRRQWEITPLLLPRMHDNSQIIKKNLWWIMIACVLHGIKKYISFLTIEVLCIVDVVSTTFQWISSSAFIRNHKKGRGKNALFLQKMLALKLLLIYQPHKKLKSTKMFQCPNKIWKT